PRPLCAGNLASIALLAKNPGHGTARGLPDIRSPQFRAIEHCRRDAVANPADRSILYYEGSRSKIFTATVKLLRKGTVSAMPFDPRAVANRLLELARERQLIIDPMKVQKLIYYAHGWHLALTGKPLLDRSVEAWQYGPVLPDVYRAFQEFGAQPITEPARYAAVDGNKL